MPAVEENKSVVLTHPSGATAHIALYGATVTSWVVEEKERIFVSQHAIRDGSKATRGGIPIVFPIFGTKDTIPLAQHGFARNNTWDYVGLITDNDQVVVRFSLKDTQLTQQQRNGWAHSFRLTYTVTLTAESLKTVLVLKNEDNDTFEFNALLHTYLLVPDVTQVAVHGLVGCPYIDKVANGEKALESREAVTIEGEVDRVYSNVPDHLSVKIGEGGINIEKINLKDTVVWNPWIEKAKNLADFGDEEYPEMICVEVGAVADWVKLAGGQTWTGGQILTVV
ncbi:galactose mutarotase-like domain-containing protein [Spinellus fusiger]|nr:galactose mutarotase-like domain-containing protein [Spinellus fusiger]